MENNRTIAERKSNNLFLILWGFFVIMFLSSIAIKDIYDISDSELSLFINHYKIAILLIFVVICICVTTFCLLFDIGEKITRSTEITGRSLEVFEYVNEFELGKYIANLKLNNKFIEKSQQSWGHTFKVKHYRWIGKFNLYVGSGWSDPIKAGDIVYFNGCEYLVLASVHTTEYSITQIYKVLMIDIK